VTIGPYAITGSLLSPAGGLNFLINNRFAMQDATVTRLDGASGAPIDAHGQSSRPVSSRPPRSLKRSSALLFA
jgi:hypothetical protein